MKCKLLVPFSIVMLLQLTACASIPHDGAAKIDAFALLQTGDQAYEQKQWPQAELAYRKLTEALPHDALAYFKLGNALVQQSRLPESVDAYQAALQREPNNAKAYSNLATVYLIQADTALTAALQQLPNNDPRVPLLVAKRNEIRNVVAIPVDESRSPGKVVTLSGNNTERP